jgi:hypothetical protein
MPSTATRTDPGLWNRVKTEITKGDKGGNPNQWSARKAQLAVAEYKKRGGGYVGGKSKDNHLSKWTKEDWGTKSGQPSAASHERYLPAKVRESLSDFEYNRTSAKKRADTAKGHQVSPQPPDIARKSARKRRSGTQTKASAGSSA